MDRNIFKVNGYFLDDEQKNIVKSDCKNILVIAGAGSGKSLTIVGKIKYLINVYNVRKEEILCISFTNYSCFSLKSSILKELNCEIEVLTFHKLALKILKYAGFNFSISENDLLEFMINEFFYYIFVDDVFYMKIVLMYFKINVLFKNVNILYRDLLINRKKDVDMLISKICTFIRLFKSSGKSYDYLEYVFFKEKHKFFNGSNVLFLLLVIKLLYEYNLELQSFGKIDFDDMIALASDVLNKKNIFFNYKYIIIDEFQDTSVVRYNLIKSLLLYSNANFMAVGDDYQSIYRFSGCELGLFLNFQSFFDDSKVYKIQTTYRNSLDLVKVCERFIKVNRSQLDKTLKSNVSLYKPIKVIYYSEQREMFYKLIVYLYNIGIRNILVLARNNDNLNDVLSDAFVVNDDNFLILNGFEGLKIRFLTVHKSKGLEEECVVVISLVDDLWGFPNKKKDERIFNYVLLGKEKCPYAEERRLFYVALTRTKSYVFLLVNKYKPSIFVKEIIKTNPNYIEILKL